MVPDCPAGKCRNPSVCRFPSRAPVSVAGEGPGFSIGPYDWPTWWLEVLPVLLAAPILIGTHRRFPLTPLTQRLILLHALVLVVGAHWTYAHVPLGEWARDVFVC